MSDALDAMVALCASGPILGVVRAGTAPGLEGVNVFDGPPLGDVDQVGALALGVSMYPDLSAAIDDERPGYGGRRSETFLISGLAQASTGEVDLSIPRRRVYAVLAAFRVQLVEHPDLDGACDWARLARHTYRPVQTERGAIAQLEFTVRVDATRFEGA